DAHADAPTAATAAGNGPSHREARGRKKGSASPRMMTVVRLLTAPIYVAKAVLEVSSELHEAAEQGAAATDQNLAGVSRDKWSEILEKMSPDDFKYKM
ncbi:MAG TPA: hypothetical protein VEF07_05295, partial [Candidatus Binataceae bacterium]|nr:hypothetical protein [Candidatus Binataceae bacterium]